MNRETEFIFRLKCIVKRCKEKGKWDLLNHLTNKYKLVHVGEDYYN